MKKQHLITIAIILLLLGGGVFLLANPRFRKSETADGGLVKSSEIKDYDFGKVPINGGKVTHLYEVSNTTASPFNITKIYTSCMCTTATVVRGGVRGKTFGMPGHGLGSSESQTSGRLMPGERMEVEVVFDPAAHGPAGLGLVERSVTLEIAGQEPILLRFTAQVVP